MYIKAAFVERNGDERSATIVKLCIMRCCFLPAYFKVHARIGGAFEWMIDTIDDAVPSSYRNNS